MSPKPSPAAVPRSLLLAYALPGVVLGMPTIPVVVLLPAFYAEDLGLGLAAVGGALLAARILDVVTDPLVGIWSDHSRASWGRRKPFILVGGLLAGLGLVRLFAPGPDPSVLSLLLWSAVLYLGWTLVNIPYTAWGAELSDDYRGRATLTAGREACTVLGLLIAGGLPALGSALNLSEAQGLALVAWTAVVLGIPALGLMLWRVPDPPRRETDRAEAPSGGQRAWTRRLVQEARALGGLLRSGPVVRLLAAWMLNALSTGLAAALFPLFVTHGLGLPETARNTLVLLYFLCGVAGLPLWLRLAGRWGKHRAWCLAMGLAVAAFAVVPLLGPGDLWPFVAVCVVTGLALGADLALPPALQADVLDYDQWRSGHRRAGRIFALSGMGQKLALALAVGGGFAALDLVGFDPTDPTPGPGALLGLAVIYALVPAVLKASAVALVWGHPITARRQRALRRRLDRRADRGRVAEGGKGRVARPSQPERP